MKFHLLFEQSGTFKNVFKEFGNEAWDYDILNDYGQTDFQIDLFNEIEKEFENITTNSKNETIFSKMQPDKDFIFAFFPCTYFSVQNELMFTGKANSGKAFNTSRIGIKLILNRSYEREKYFKIFLKFCFICQELKIPTIIENPAHENYLNKWSPFYKGKFIEKDRTLYGDKLKKPTMFIPINFEMKENFIMFDKEINRATPINKQPKGKTRSEITPRYARNFYKRFIKNYVDKKGEKQ